MTAQIEIQPGQWVLAYVDQFCTAYIDDDMPRALERLTSGGSGWACLSPKRPWEQFMVSFVAKAMPKTWENEHGWRGRRSFIIAVADTQAEMLALRDELFSIGFVADKQIEEETARVMADFERATKADALAKIHAALPHMFPAVA
ncbi:hypothetical protein [Mesorhizobium wenxiniae]|uniref:Uncharacterized protein n=1 Tax=Mesorhizobium wenxiniae TaxID=2014805 RepID=A0A271KH99_9HYPH|nr:hypothetical protein [Mesorhizobium wenxiniae]PAP94507.1 hypothetical protein CIT31_16035 [Mesorhizobium wenxiniae]